VGNASETASEPGSNAFQRLTSECAIAEDEIEIAFLREKSARSAS
jgi:hypothetical protein